MVGKGYGLFAILISAALPAMAEDVSLKTATGTIYGTLLLPSTTPAPLAISRTPTPSYPARAKARRAETRIASRVAAASRRLTGAMIFFTFLALIIIQL